MDKYNKKWVMTLAQGETDKWAITIGQVTYYSCAYYEVNPNWRRHEEVHKKQWKQYGFRFPFLYLWELIRNGYWNSRFEIEARDNTNQ